MPAKPAPERRGKDAAIRRVREQEQLAHDHARAVQTTVDIAREKGATWEEIGEVFGVTKQAAQMRFGKGK